MLPFFHGHTYNVGKKFPGREYGFTHCIICNQEFKKFSPVSITCGKECRKQYYIDLMQTWHRENYDHEYLYRQDQTRQLKWSITRKNRRREIYDTWGRQGREDWKQAEKDALRILEHEGYANIKHLSEYFPQVVFDICATKNGKTYVFQVTTRTHTTKKKQHRLATDLGLIHKALFVSTINKMYILKDLSQEGYTELSVEEMMSASKYV